jgi:hypothetical protein
MSSIDYGTPNVVRGRMVTEDGEPLSPGQQAPLRVPQNGRVNLGSENRLGVLVLISEEDNQCALFFLQGRARGGHVLDPAPGAPVFATTPTANRISVSWVVDHYEIENRRPGLRTLVPIFLGRR